MKLPDELRRAIAVGTMHIDTLPPSIASVDHVVNRVEGRIEAQILLKVAGLTLRKQAGYTVNTDNRPLETPCPPDELKVISQNSVYHLVLMLRDKHLKPKQATNIKLDFGSLLPEWCILAAILKLRIPEEWLAAVLKYGQGHKSLQQYLIPLLGQRGQWLVQKIHNEDWEWALDTTETDPRSLPQTERWRETEIIEALSTKSIDSVGNQHSGLAKLQTYRTLWSKVLADIFVNALEYGNIIGSPPSEKILSILDRCVYHFPLDRTQRLFDFLSQGTEEWQQKKIELHSQFNFRYEILDELDKTAHQL